MFRQQGKRDRNGFYSDTRGAAKVKIRRQVDNGRGDNARDYLLTPFHLSGMFGIGDNRTIQKEEMAAGADLEEKNHSCGEMPRLIGTNS